MRNLLLLAALAVSSVACAVAPDADEGSASSTSNITASGDQTDPANAKGDRVAATTTIFGRSIALHISDADDAGWASIDSGNSGDEVWLNRSFDGGKSWGDNLLSNGKLGDTKTPTNDRGWRTLMYGLDNASAHQVGVLRACGKAGDRDDVACTPWLRAKAATPTDAAASALMAMYNSGNGQWNNIGWWNSANALTALVDYSQASGNQTFRWAVDNTFTKNDSANFINDFMDDTGWWGLAWVRAYDLTGNSKYLDVAKKTADYIYSFKDGHCGGGVWWNTKKQYKNAITNELYIKLAAALHNRIPGDTSYLAHADEIWSWFQSSGMINGKNLINDGLDNTSCKNNNQTAWTYNQGVILGGLAELEKAHGDGAHLTAAKTLADASTSDGGLNPNGILRESCEGNANNCGGDAPTFKGVYVRNLGELNEATNGNYDAYLGKQASALANAHDSLDQYGVTWSTKPASSDAASQASALDALVANYIATK